jgi:hypothetical protein
MNAIEYEKSIGKRNTNGKLVRQIRFVRIEDIRFPILEYKDGKIDANELITKLEKILNE